MTRNVKLFLSLFFVFTLLSVFATVALAEPEDTRTVKLEGDLEGVLAYFNGAEAPATEFQAPAGAALSIRIVAAEGYVVDSVKLFNYMELTPDENGVYTVDVTADDVTYVQLVESRRYYDDFGKDFRQYVTEETSKLQITDSEAIKTVVNCLDETYDFFNKYGGIDEWYSDSYHGSYVEKEEYAEIYTFKIKTKSGLTKYRNIRLYEDDITVVRESLKKMPGYTDLWTSLPEPQRGTVTMDTGRFSITNEQAAEIFETFRREVVSTDFDKWVELNTNYGPTFAYFYYQTASVYLTVPVSTELFPKTVDQLLAYASENSEENMKELEEAMEEYKYADVMYVELMEYSDGYMNHYSPKVNFFDTEELDVILEAKDDSEFELDDTYLIVEIEFRNDGYDTKEDFKYLSAVIKVKEDSVDMMREYFGY